MPISDKIKRNSNNNNNIIIIIILLLLLTHSEISPYLIISNWIIDEILHIPWIQIASLLLTDLISIHNQDI